MNWITSSNEHQWAAPFWISSICLASFPRKGCGKHCVYSSTWFTLNHHESEVRESHPLSSDFILATLFNWVAAGWHKNPFTGGIGVELAAWLQVNWHDTLATPFSRQRDQVLKILNQNACPHHPMLEKYHLLALLLLVCIASMRWQYHHPEIVRSSVNDH
jgi:hypothetical protein